MCGFCSRGNCQKSSASRWWMKTAVDVPVFSHTLEVRKYLPVIDGPPEPHNNTLSQFPSASPGSCAAPQIFWYTPDNSAAFRAGRANERQCVFFPELLSIVLLVSRARRLLHVDRPLTQGAIHPPASPIPPPSRMSLLWLPGLFSKTTDLSKEGRLWLRSSFVCSLVIISSRLCKELAWLDTGVCEVALKLHPAVFCAWKSIFSNSAGEFSCAA